MLYVYIKKKSVIYRQHSIMSDFTFKPKRNKHLCCPPFIDKMDINSPTLIYRFPCRIKLAMNVRSAIGSSNHTQCYTVANEKLNAYGKWAGCPGGSGPGYSSTMRFNPGELSSGLGPFNGGSHCNCAYRAPLPPYLPVNIEAPIISGNTVYGSTLTLTGEGIWIGNPSPTLSFQWLRNGVVIGGATSITYVTLLTDVGQPITCRVTGTNIVGSVNAISNVITVTSLPSNTVTPVISGNPVVGFTLTTTNGTWTGFPAPTFTYQWLRNGVVIVGATIITYVTRVADVGQQITCRVRGTNILGFSEEVSNIIIPQNVTTPSQTVTFTGTVNFQLIYVNSLNQVDTGPVLNGFTIYRVTSTSLGTTYLINSNLPSTSISFLIVGGGGSGGGNNNGDGGSSGSFGWLSLLAGMLLVARRRLR